MVSSSRSFLSCKYNKFRSRDLLIISYFSSYPNHVNKCLFPQISDILCTTTGHNCHGGIDHDRFIWCIPDPMHPYHLINKRIENYPYNFQPDPSSKFCQVSRAGVDGAVTCLCAIAQRECLNIPPLHPIRSCYLLHRPASRPLLKHEHAWSCAQAQTRR